MEMAQEGQLDEHNLKDLQANGTTLTWEPLLPALLSFQFSTGKTASLNKEVAEESEGWATGCASLIDSLMIHRLEASAREESR